MPLDIYERHLSDTTPDHYRNVIREHPETAVLLVEKTGRRLFEASFNGRPIALLVTCLDTQKNWLLEALVVHPANQGRGIDQALLDAAQRMLGAALVDDTARHR